MQLRVWCVIILSTSSWFGPQLANANAPRFDGQITLGSTFTGNQTHKSANGSYELGLFRPPASDSIYLGIWYANIYPQTVVWVANRNQPGIDIASFTLSVDGELKMLDTSGRLVWSSNTKGLNVSAAILLDTGNLVLQTNNSTSVWQSFNYPGNTWLPSMKFRPGQQLRSWTAVNNPADGPYSLEMHPTEFVSRWNNSKQYWSSGHWNGRTFSAVPEMVNASLYDFYMDSTGFSWIIDASEGFTSRCVIDTDGEIKQLLWSSRLKTWTNIWSQPHDPCDVYGLCGIFGVCQSNSSPFCSCPSGFRPVHPHQWESQAWSAGCQLSSLLNCSEGGGSTDGFIALNQTSFDGHSLQMLDGRDPDECRLACSRNCSCVAYYHDEPNGICALMTQILLNGRSSPFISGISYLRVPSQVLRPQGSQKKKPNWLIVIVTASGALILVVSGVGLFLIHRRGQPTVRPSRNFIPGELRRFSYGELQYATNQFAERLGCGGFGAVYRGVLPDNSRVAVKMLQSLHQGEKQFRTEVSTIGTIQHVNLVRLLGFCSERSHRLLVYEYVANGSLDEYMLKSNRLDAEDGNDDIMGGSGSSNNVDHDKEDTSSNKKKKVLSWGTRLEIAMGTARGMAYLHEECRDCIIHCDIKPANILLDERFEAKVSDFGLAKLMGRDFSRVLTTMRGTRGYLAPEWLAGVAVTSKADVYSFGMTLLEMISGMKNMDYKRSSAAQRCFFPIWAAKQIINGGDLLSLLDPRLAAAADNADDVVDVEELRRALCVAIWCIQDERKKRPTMKVVVKMLEGSIPVFTAPVPRSLQVMVDDEDEGTQ